MQDTLSTLRRAALSRRTLAVAGCGISAFFAVAAVRKVDLHTFASGVAASRPAWVVLSVLALAVAVVLRTLRWQVLFEPRTRPGFRLALRALLIGYFFNNILPARAGEAARIVVLHREAASSRAEVTGTAITERVYDVLSLLAILFVAVPFLPHVTWLHRATIAAIVVVSVVAAVAVAARLGGNRSIRLASALAARLPWFPRERVESAGHNLVTGLKAFWRPRLMAPAIALTLASWMLIALSGWLALLALHLELPFGAGVLVAVATNLAMVLPSSPGALGVFEAATLLALKPFGVSPSEGLAYAVVLHAINFFPYIVVGGMCLQVHAAQCRRLTPRAIATPVPTTEGV